MDFQCAIFFLLTLVHISTNFPALGDKSPCNEFPGEFNSDIILYCDEPDTTLEQIKNSLNAIDGRTTIGLELYQVNLGTVPSDFFKGHNITELTIAFCEVESLTGGGGRPFEGLENTLEVLMIKGSLSEKNAVEMSLLGHLKKLTELQLISNSIREVGNSWFSDTFPVLRTLDLSENNIEKLGQRAFSNLRALQYIFLNGNRFGHVARSMFPMPSKLGRIELENNDLLEIPSDLFSQMPDLESVSLASNVINTIPEETWKPFWMQLKNIDLSDNLIQCDSHLDWILETPTCAKVSADCKNSDAEFPSTVKSDSCS